MNPQLNGCIQCQHNNNNNTDHDDYEEHDPWEFVRVGKREHLQRIKAPVTEAI